MPIAVSHKKELSPPVGTVFLISVSRIAVIFNHRRPAMQRGGESRDAIVSPEYALKSRQNVTHFCDFAYTGETLTDPPKPGT